RLDTMLLVDSLALAQDALLARGLKSRTMAATGVSFGSILAALSATRHPERVSAIGLYGLFWGTQEDTDWVFQKAHDRYSPELANQFGDFCRRNGGDPDEFVASFSRFFSHSDYWVRNEA